MKKLALFSRYRLYRGAGEWTPVSLFDGGVQGAIYDPSYLNTYMSGLGPELVAPIDFNTGWTASGAAITVNSATSFTSAGVSNYYIAPFTVGRWYAVTINATFTGASANLYNSASATNQITPLGLTSGVSQTFYFQALATQFNIRQSSAGTVTVNSISVKEVTTIGNATMFTTSAGTTPVTAVEQNVGLILDQSQGPVLGSELVTGAASAYTGNGTVATVGDTITATCTTNGIYGITWASTFVSNLWVLLTVEAVTNSASKSLLIFPNGNSTALAGGTTTGNKSFITLAPTATGSTRCPIFYINGLVGESFSIRLASIKSYAGNHAYVTADANRGILRSRFNQLTYSEQFDNAVWNKIASYVQTNLLTYSTLAGAVAGTPGTAPTGWSFGVSGGTTTVNPSSISLSATTGNRHFISNPVSLSANTTYTVSLNVNSVSGSSSDAVVFVLVTTGSIASGTILLLGSDGTGRKTLTFTTGGTATTISLRVGPGCSGAVTSNGAIDFDSPQLVQGSVPGDYRATAASVLPILYTDPLGGLTAQALAGDGGNTTHEVRHTITTSGAAIHTVSTYLKQNTERYAYVVMLGRSVTDDNGDAVFLDLQTGTIVSSSGSGIYATLTLINNGWYRVVVPTSSYPASTQIEIRVGVANAPSAQASTASGSIFVWGGQLVPTDVFPTNTYQRIAAATDYATGPAFPLYIQTDGTNDAMLTNTINFANGPSSPPLGPELVTNGDFSDGTTGWTLAAGSGGSATISGGALTLSGGTSSFPNATQSTILTSGKYYSVTVVMSSAVTSGSLALRMGGGTATYQLFTSAGTYTLKLFADGTDLRFIRNSGFSDTAVIDSISVKEIDSAYAPDKMTVTAGVTKLSDAAVGMLTELSADLGANNGGFSLYAPSSAASPRYAFFSKGTSRADAEVVNTIYAAPQTSVLSGVGNISAPSVALRFNDSQVATSTATQGTGTYGNYPLYLFARGNASLYFNGYFYGAVVVQKFLSAGELASLTNWMEVRTFGKDMSYSYDYLTLANGDLVTLDNGDPVYTNIYYS